MVFVWCVAPAIYYSNVWYSAYLPFSSAVSYDRFGHSCASASQPTTLCFLT